MKTIMPMCILYACSSLILPSYSQDGDWHVTPFGTMEGLASSDIGTLFQDSDHLLWIGHSAGLSRFDGHAIENFLFAGNRRVGKVYSLIEDKDQTLWIGAEGGLFFFRQNKLYCVQIGTKPLQVYTLALHQKDSLWAGTDIGPARYSIAKLQQAALHEENVELKILPAWKNSPFPPKKSKFICAAADGTIYFSDGYTLFKYAGDKLTELYTIAENRDYITGLVGLDSDTVYISSQLRGFWMLDGEKIQRYSFSDGIGNALTRNNGRLLYFAYEGVYAFDPKNNTARFLFEMPDQYREWGSCVLRDTENNFWIGTHEELLLARPALFHAVKQPLLVGFNELYSVYENTDGSLLVGGNRGRLFKKDKNKSCFSLSKTVFPLSEVFDTHKTENGDTWFSSGYEGLSLLRNGKLTNYRVQNGLRSNGNYKFLSAPDKTLFACGENGITKIVYGPKNGISFKNYYTDNYTIVTDGIANPDGSLTLGSDHGLLEWKNDSLYSIPILNFERRNPSLTGIARDGLGNVWISTIGDGILLCKKEAGGFVLKKQFDAQDGLPAVIYLQLLIDHKGMVWALGYNGIVRIEPKPETGFFVKSFGNNHGFTSSNFHSAKMLQDKEGIIWVATSAGLMYFQPETFDRSYQRPVCNITEVSFPGKTGNGGYGADPEVSGTIRLPYHARSVSFHFTGIHFSDPTAVRYAYRLLGADSTWIPIGQERTINLQKLSPGDYVFQVKALLGNDITSNIDSHAFKVLSPWWQQWWFILFSILCLIALSIFIIKRRERNIKKTEAEKTELQQFKAESLQHQLEIEQIINFFATSMNELKSIDSMLWDVAKNCISKLGLKDCVIYLKDEKRKVLLQKAAWGPKTTDDNKIIDPIEIPMGRGIVGSVAQTGNPEIIADTGTDPRYIIDDMERGSEISVPIVDNNAVIGVIDSEHPQKNFYTEKHLLLLTAIASLISNKIDKINAQQKANKKEIEVLKLNQDLTLSQLVALRAQMNPHFIFNALNSVQQYILRGDVIEANKYLSKFSKLQRDILNHCDQNFIFLEKEMEMLDLYLQLEQLRFNGTFTYHLDLDGDIDADEIKIPPMLVQPFVENAIWHGLMPKSKNRQLEIHFSLSKDDMLSCTIRDNGIGREAASRMRQASGNGLQHKSKGLSLVHERMDILRQQYRQPFDVAIADLTDSQGNPQGTLVTLTVFAGH